MGDSGWRGWPQSRPPPTPSSPLPGHPGSAHRAAEQTLLRGSAALGQRAGLQPGGTGHGESAAPPDAPREEQGPGPPPAPAPFALEPLGPSHQGRLCGASATGPGLGPPVWGPRPWPLGAPGPGPSGTPVTTALSCQALMSNVLHFCLLVPGLVFSLCVLNVVTDSMLTKAVSASDTGEHCGGGRRGPGLGTPRRSSPESLIWVGVGDLGSWARWDSGPRRLR